jgi:hypothetical protein
VPDEFAMTLFARELVLAIARRLNWRDTLQDKKNLVLVVKDRFRFKASSNVRREEILSVSLKIAICSPPDLRVKTKEK